MTADDPFDRDLRATLEGMAREPAPEGLVARVAGVPREVPARPGLGARLLGAVRGSLPGFAAVAAIVVVAVVAIVLRSPSGPKVGDSPSLAVIPTPSASAEPSPSVVASAPPTQPSPPASSTPVPSQRPTSVPTARPIAGGPVPDVFQPVSVTFVSVHDGWVLGRGACGGQDCPVIARTSDGGGSWTTIEAPPTDILVASPMDSDPGQGVSGLRFADASDGWAFGPGLWSTHDGGVTWATMSVPGIPQGSKVVALGSGHGTVHAVFYDGSLFRIASSPIGSDAWTVSSVRIDLGGGPVPTVQLVLSGDAGWVLVNNRVVIAGARLRAGAWVDWDPPCATFNGPAVMDASSPTDLVAVCDAGEWGDPGGEPIGEHLYSSRDGGLTFVREGTVPPVLEATGISAAGTASVVVAGGDATGSILVTTSDAGRTWKTVLRPSLDQVSELGFTSASQGVLILTDDQGQGRLLMTHDGGRTWTPVRFQP